MFTIIGATGRIGGAAARDLRRRGRAVRAIVRDPGKAGALADSGCDIAVADIADTGALTTALRGTEGVLAIVPLNPSRGDAAVETRGLIDSLGRALEAARPPRTVAISDYGAQHPAGTGITVLFHDLEQRLGGLPGIAFLRSAEHMQNWARSLRAATATGVLASLHHPLDKRFPTVSAPDVGRIAADLLAAAEAPPRILHAEGPQRYTRDRRRRCFGRTARPAGPGGGPAARPMGPGAGRRRPERRLCPVDHRAVRRPQCRPDRGRGRRGPPRDHAAGRGAGGAGAAAGRLIRRKV